MSDLRAKSAEQYDRESHAIARQLPSGQRVAIIGSASFWGDDSRVICRVLGNQLATVKNVALLTGGVSGVGEAVGRSFFEARLRALAPPATYHILPHGSKIWDYGETVFGGLSMGERREILGRLARICIAVEGGPGTAHEADVALQSGADVIPVARTGGCSADLYPRLGCPSPKVELEWSLLNDRMVNVERLGVAVRRIVEFLLQPNA